MRLYWEIGLKTIISEKLTDNDLDEIVEILNQKCICCPSEVDNVPSEDNC